VIDDHPISDHVQVTRDGPATTIWLSRPEKRNAMNLDMWIALSDACRAVSADSRTVIVRGTGDHFCAGADLATVGDRADVRYADANREAEQALAAVPAPTIAFVTGFCVGGGVQIAAACDLRVCDATAKFGITPARFGIVYPPSALEAVVRLIGPANAKRLLFTADLIDSHQALQMGLVQERYETETATAKLSELVHRLGSRSMYTQVATKQMIDSVAASGAIAPALVERWQLESAANPDAHEGIAAFLEHRTPTFTWTPASAEPTD
jgi:enoyl-CoA hydratase/carnithine racemase